MKARQILPELLDVLPPRDAAALRSRRDLRRINAWMGHSQIMARTLRDNWPGGPAQNIVELGAGDGHFLLSVARRLRGLRPGTEAILVDRLDLLEPATGDAFSRAGWRVRAEIAEAAGWLGQAPRGKTGALVSNLFFHQFTDQPLGEMLRLAAETARLVIALEPRRAWRTRLCGALLWAIGCGPVTRHDARISIRAGFVGGELSALWPRQPHWRITERPAGLFSHLFIARRED